MTILSVVHFVRTSILAATLSCIVPAAGGLSATEVDAPATNSEASDDTVLDAVMTRYWDRQMQLRPLAGNLFGDSRYMDRLDDYSEAGFQGLRDNIDDTLAAAAKINRAALSAANQTNYDMLIWMLENERPALDQPTRYQPFSSISSWNSILPVIAANTLIRTRADADDYIKRLSQTGALADQMIALVKQGIARGYVHPCDSITGYHATITVPDTAQQSFAYIPATRLSDSLSKATQDQIAADITAEIDNTVTPALQRYRDFIRDDYEPKCRHTYGLSALEGGRDAYEYWVRYYATTGDMTADRVHTLGLSEVARIRGEMQAVADEVEFDGDLAAFFEFMRTNPDFFTDDPEVYLSRVARIAKRIDEQLPAYFAYQPRNRFTTTPVPDSIAPRTTIAYYQPGSAKSGTPGRYFVNLYNLKTKSLNGLPALSIHEASPGHHWQISIQQELQNVPDFRRFYYISAFGEGWGLYTEYLGQEMGIYETPYEYFERLSYEMWRACRLVVDSGIHAKGWSRQQAIDYMAANSSLSTENITNEVDRYITLPGQAISYKLGELKIKQLRQEAEDALGEAFSLRDWHAHLLLGGALPLAALETRMDAWVASELGSN